MRAFLLNSCHKNRSAKASNRKLLPNKTDFHLFCNMISDHYQTTQYLAGNFDFTFSPQIRSFNRYPKTCLRGNEI